MRIGARSDGTQPLRDLDAVRSYLSGLGPVALFDLPWIPLYLAICFAFHPLIGFAALAGAIILIVLTLLTEILMRAPARAATEAAVARNGLAEASRRNAEALVAMGMAGHIAARWSEANRQYMRSQQEASDLGGGLGAISKVLRMMLQSGVLAVGAYLVIHQEASAGIIIAGSILSARALAPVDLAIANWKGFVAARQSWQRLNRLLTMSPARLAPMQLQTPVHRLTVESRQRFTARRSKSCRPGYHVRTRSRPRTWHYRAQRIRQVFPGAAAGRRLAAGARQCSSRRRRPRSMGVGCAWPSHRLFAARRRTAGGHCRREYRSLRTEPDTEAVIAAAKAVGVHDLIVRLPAGYDTPIGEQGSALSAGQAQRVALARAVYRDPFLVVLDEPNSNLDSEGEEALTRAILGVRERMGIVIVVAHRPSAIAGVDRLLMMNQGKAQAIGPKDEILSKVLQRPLAIPRPLKIVPESGSAGA